MATCLGVDDTFKTNKHGCPVSVFVAYDEGCHARHIAWQMTSNTDCASMEFFLECVREEAAKVVKERFAMFEASGASPRPNPYPSPNEERNLMFTTDFAHSAWAACRTVLTGMKANTKGSMGFKFSGTHMTEELKATVFDIDTDNGSSVKVDNSSSSSTLI